MCFDIDRIVDQDKYIAEYYKCSLCKKVLCYSNLNNLQSKECVYGHAFCGRCIQMWLQYHTSCPDCGTKLNATTLLHLNISKEQQLKLFKIWCKNYKFGCQTCIKIEEIDLHEKNCPFNANNISSSTINTHRSSKPEDYFKSSQPSNNVVETKQNSSDFLGKPGSQIHKNNTFSFDKLNRPQTASQTEIELLQSNYKKLEEKVRYLEQANNESKKIIERQNEKLIALEKKLENLIEIFCNDAKSQQHEKTIEVKVNNSAKKDDLAELENRKNQSKNERFSSIRYPGLRNPSYDMLIYKSGYIGDIDDPKLNKNLEFYKGKIKSQPKGDNIDIILSKWYGNYNLLELHHGYIQWLFPLREEGMNSESQPLQLHELNELKKDNNVRYRLIKAYEMMLDFYGMRIVNETGQIGRTTNYKERYENLQRHTHNYLRITRILKCLGEFEFELYQIKFLEFLIEKIFFTRELQYLDESMTKYWVHTLRNDQERERLIANIENIVDSQPKIFQSHFETTI